MTSTLEAYMEEKVLSADPLELVRILYRGALEAVEQARRQLAAGNIAARSRAASKAVEILAELSASLDRERAPEVSERLAVMYDYIERRILQGNFEQVDAPFAESLQLLETLAEAWKGLTVSTATNAPGKMLAARVRRPQTAEPDLEADRNWSF